MKEAVGFTRAIRRQDSIQSQEVAVRRSLRRNDTRAGEVDFDEANQRLPAVCNAGVPDPAGNRHLTLFPQPVCFADQQGREEPDSFEALLNNYTAHTNGNGNGNGHLPIRPGANGQTPSALTPAELSRLIRENPDNASQALKSWLRRN